MATRNISIAEVKRIDMVEHLERLGYKPAKIRNNDYWYLSPLRDEKTPSFKVTRSKNVWYDHAIGKGGTLVDFGKLYYQCTVKDLLSKLQNEKEIIVSFHPPKIQLLVKRKNTQSNPERSR